MVSVSSGGINEAACSAAAPLRELFFLKIKNLCELYPPPEGGKLASLVDLARRYYLKKRISHMDFKILILSSIGGWVEKSWPTERGLAK